MRKVNTVLILVVFITFILIIQEFMSANSLIGCAFNLFNVDSTEKTALYSFSKFTVRTLCDTIPQRENMIVYIFNHPDNNIQSVVDGTYDLWLKLKHLKIKILIFDVSNSNLKTNIPNWSGGSFLKKLLLDKGVTESAILWKPWPHDVIHTLVEAEEINQIVFKELKASALLLISIALHQPRAFLTTISVMSKNNNNNDRSDSNYEVYSIPGAPLEWGEMTVHNQGVVTGTRVELLDIEFDRIERYHNKGDLISPTEALQFLHERDLRNKKK